MRDLNGHSVDDLPQGRRRTLHGHGVGPVNHPERTGVCGMYLDGRWFNAINPDLVPVADPVRRLDVSVFSEQVLGPILGIADLRATPASTSSAASAAWRTGTARRQRRDGRRLRHAPDAD